MDLSLLDNNNNNNKKYGIKPNKEMKKKETSTNSIKSCVRTQQQQQQKLLNKSSPLTESIYDGDSWPNLKIVSFFVVGCLNDDIYYYDEYIYIYMTFYRDGSRLP